uniref:Uncharacterized protein n=1 Tax=Anopheles culicifacies TaxID=139723 RepID=A0A182MTG0_9DIPT
MSNNLRQFVLMDEYIKCPSAETISSPEQQKKDGELLHLGKSFPPVRRCVCVSNFELVHYYTTITIILIIIIIGRHEKSTQRGGGAGEQFYASIKHILLQFDRVAHRISSAQLAPVHCKPDMESNG